MRFSNPSSGFQIRRGGGSVVVNADGTISLVGNTDITGTLAASGNLTVSGTGPHVIGGAVQGHRRLVLAGPFTSDGGSTRAQLLHMSGTLTGAVGDEVRLVGAEFAGLITTQDTNTNISVIAQAYFVEPNITNNLASGGKPDVAVTVYIANAPDEGDVNAALYVAAGDVNFQSTLQVAGLITATSGIKLGTTVTLTEGSANVLELATGDSFNIVSGSLTVYGITVGRGASNIVSNTAVGSGVLDNNTTGNTNVGFGFNALAAITEGSINAAFGVNALQTTSTGNNNTTVGVNALRFNITGNNNIGIGSDAGKNEVGSGGFYVDAFARADTAADKVGAILYGQMNATPANQILTVNAKLVVAQDLEINGTTGIGAGPSANADLLLEAGRLMLKESATPSADSGYGKVYTKTDDKLYFQDGAGVEHTFSVADYAAIRFDDNSSAETIDLTDQYHLVTRFATNGLDEVSTSDQANNRLTIGASRDYNVALCGSAQAAGGSKVFVFDVFEISQSTANITAITQATPGVVTAAGHGFSNGNLCKITGVVGMTEVNDKIYKVAGVSGADFSLQDDEGVSIATGAFGAWSSGGTVALATKTFAHSDRTFSNASGFGAFGSHWYYLATSGDAMEFYIKNKSDATDITFEHLNLTVKAL